MFGIPTISNQNGKSEIAYLYTRFGWAIIQDMYARALAASILDSEIKEARKAMTKLQENKVKLTEGTAWRTEVDKFVYDDLECEE